MGASNAKLALKEALFKLQEEAIPEDKEGFWSQLWTLPASVDDVYSTLRF